MHQETVIGVPPALPSRWPAASGRLARRLEFLSELQSLFVLVLGAGVIIGWLFDVTLLKSVLPNLPAMKVNLAVGLILLAAALWMVQPKRTHSLFYRAAARLACAAAMLIGALTLVEYIAVWDLDIDELLVKEGPGALYNTHPGRQSPLAALNLMLTGFAIIAIDAPGRRGHWPGHAALLVVGATSLLTFIGHINGIHHFLQFIPESSAIAFHATIAFLALAAGILFARPHNGLATILISESPGGLLARRVLLPAIVVMPLFDHAVSAGVNTGLLDARSEGAVHTTWLIVFITAVLVAAAWLLEKAERRRTQAEAERTRLANAVKHAGDAVIITNAEGLIEYANPAFETASGYPIGDVMGKKPSILKSGRQNAAFYENLWHTIKAGHTWRGHIVNCRKNGMLYEEEMTVSPITGGDGTVLNFVAVKRDVTREAALHRSRSCFTTIVSHELRTPLTSLRLMETILQQIELAGPMGERVEYLRGALLKTIASLDRIVDATSLIVEMSHARDERLFSKSAVHHTVTRALDDARESRTAQQRNVGIEADIGGIPHNTAVLGSGALLQRALEEVLSNAIKFTPDGKSVRLRQYIRDGAVHIEIVDEGTGIPEESLNDVLIPYHFLENSLNFSPGRYNYRGSGLGLGLTIVKLIMDHQNGKLAIANRQDRQGMLVVLSLPLAPDQELTALA